MCHYVLLSIKLWKLACVWNIHICGVEGLTSFLARLDLNYPANYTRDWWITLYYLRNLATLFKRKFLFLLSRRIRIWHVLMQPPLEKQRFEGEALFVFLALQLLYIYYASSSVSMGLSSTSMLELLSFFLTLVCNFFQRTGI